MALDATSVIAVLLNTAIAGTVLALGGVLGWWLRSRVPMRTEDAERLKDQARESLERLQELANSVAADVGEHHIQVLRINQELESGGGATQSEQVVLASLAQLISANEQLQSQLHNAEHRLAAQAKELETHALDARTDQLTNLTNRRGFDDALARRYAEWQRRGRPHCLVLLDVDHFKKFNDTHGHQAGDEVLRQVAAALLQSMRDMDIVCRYGGEEFAIVMPDTTAAEGAIGAERARRAIEAVTVRYGDKDLKVTASEGLAEILPSDDPASLIRRADEALYFSKQAGRNRASYHDGEKSRPISDLKQAEPQAEANLPTKEPQEDARRVVPSQSQFRSDLKRRVAECHRFNGNLSIMLVEISNYKDVEARFGHELSQQVMKTVGEFLGSAFREMDQVTSYGKATFAAMLPGTPLGGARVIASRVFDAISACRLPLEDEEITLSIRLGLAEYLPSDNAESLLARADGALQATRKPGSVAALAHDGDVCVPLAPVQNTMVANTK